MTRLYLIDGTALAYRSFFAFASTPRGGLNTKDGRPTGAVYGFVQTLRALLDREHPDHVVVSFDGAREGLVRTKMYAEYKSTRSKMPDELVPQLSLCEKVVDAFGIPVVKSDVHEADDVIGTLAVQGRAAGMEVFIVTGDKDFMQIVDDKVKLWNLRTSTRAPEIIGPKEVEAKFGVKPAQIVDLLALMGDSSDNVPGVPKVGEKTATELLRQFETLDAILARTEEVTKPAIRKSLLEHRDAALLSRKLVTLHTDVELPCPVTELPPVKPERASLEAIFRELEFDSLLASLPIDAATVEAVATDYQVIRTEAELSALLATLRQSKGFAVATETSAADARRAEMVGIAFSTGPGVARYVPCHAQPPILADGRVAVLNALRPVLEDAGLAKFSEDSKRDMAALRRAGITLRGVTADTMLASYCLSPGQGSHRLDALALRYLGHHKQDAKTQSGTGKRQRTFADVDVEQTGLIASEAADLVGRVLPHLDPELESTGVAPLYRELELPLVPVLLDMEWEGIAIDRDHLARLSRDWQHRIERIERRIYERAGHEFNLNAPAQIGEVLFEKLEVHRAAGIGRPRRTPTGKYKTDHTILEQLAPHHEVPELILEYRQLSKLKSTWVDSLPTMIDPDTGRVHTSFNQAVAATGRLSSDNPNLQNIPIRTEEGREVRRAFVARAGFVLMSADYSQIELRILAHMAHEPSLIESFKKGEDIHTRTAALVHGLLPNLVTPELRNQAKIINYGLIYGMGASRLAQETGLRPPEAKKFIDAYFKALPRVKAYLDETLHAAREHLFVTTLFGRRRPLPEIQSSNAMQRIAAENMAVNTPIQGAAADIVKRAMLALHAALAKTKVGAKLLLQVHDELVLDVPAGEVDVVKGLVRDAMEGAAKLRVPLAVSLSTGPNWLEAH